MNIFRSLFSKPYQRWIVAALLLTFTSGALFAIVRYRSGDASNSGEQQSTDAVSFTKDIQPIFNESCVDCHGGVTQKGGVNVIYRDNLLSEAASGKKPIVPGEPENSELINRVTHDDPDKRMPYKAKPLSKDQISDLKTWIDNGAEWGKHWAYQKLEPVDPPQVSDSSWPRNGIDRFVLRKLGQNDLSPSSRAECHTLIRRLSLDLRGIPPSENDVNTYCKNPTPETYEQLVDKYLNSDDYGERWATMWLDLARYADSVGFEKDRIRTMWKYRDWVIKAFNKDKPFDDFTIEQLAGDLLDNPSKDQLLATAYHRNTRTNTEGGSKDAEYRIKAVIDRVNNTMEAWQATTMECVQCHSHPYEPIKHTEFYEFYAFFNQTKDHDNDMRKKSLPGYRMDYPKYPFLNNEKKQKKAAKLYREIESLRRKRDKLIKKPEHQKKFKNWVQKARKELDKASEKRGRLVKKISGKSLLVDIIEMPAEKRTPNQQWRLEHHYAHYVNNPPFKKFKNNIKKKKKALSKLDPVMIPIMSRIREGIRRKTRVFNRGNWKDKGERVKPDVPDFLNDMPEDAPRNRLGLAKWLVSPENPLTARVMVNRFWSKIFGRGIVKSTGNFTSRGSEPSHPKLLDWLARKFIHEHDWSMKSLIKQIVMSATYRQSSKIPKNLKKMDPENKLLARGPRFRLSAEQIRDQALDVAGLLRDKMYGPPVKPPQPDGLWERISRGNNQWKNDSGEDRFRRAVYVFRRRSVPYPSFTTFDAPARRGTCSRRQRTNSPRQALVTLNDTAYVEAARGLADRMKKEADEPRKQIRRGYEMAVFHAPSETKLNELVSLYEETLEHYKSNKSDAKKLTGVGVMDEAGPKTAALTVIGNTILNLDSFLNKE